MVKGKLAYVSPNKYWTRKGRILDQPLPLSTLFSASSEQWNSDLRQRLYSTSWTFIYFMMENPKRKRVLAKIIKREQQSLCDVISEEAIKQELGVSLNRLQKQFSRWKVFKLKTHSI